MAIYSQPLADFLAHKYMTKVKNLFEVVSERPVAQHLEESVVVDILPDVVQVVVLAASADALLAVDDAAPFRHVRVGVDCANKHRLELVHPGVGEQQGGVVPTKHFVQSILLLRKKTFMNQPKVPGDG